MLKLIMVVFKVKGIIPTRPKILERDLGLKVVMSLNLA